MLGDRKTFLLRGNAPWGFRLSGGIYTPVYISKVRRRSKAALVGLTAGDTVLSINGILTVNKSLREVNNVIDNIRNKLVIEVESTNNPNLIRLDSSSSINTTDSAPVHSTHRITPIAQLTNYRQHKSLNTIRRYPSYTSSFSQIDNKQNQHFMDSYGRVISNPLPQIFRTGAIPPNPHTTSFSSSREQPYNFYSTASNDMYNTPYNYNVGKTSGYISDTNDRRDSINSNRSTAFKSPNFPLPLSSRNYQQPPSYKPTPTIYSTQIASSNDQNYYSDSEYVTPGPRYTKITRQVVPPRRPSNIVLPIRSISSKAYDEYIPSETPKQQQQQQQLFDVYRYQQEQRERERQRQELLQRQFYEQQQQQEAASRFKRPLQVLLPSQDQRRKSDTAIDHELGAELIKSPIANKKRYADSSFFATPFNTYPTIEEQKMLARRIARILEGGDPSQKGASKFEKQRQRAEKYSLECESAPSTTVVSTYRPMRTVQTTQVAYYDTSDLPECIKHSLREVQNTNPLRSVGAPEEFKQVHMQEHVTHTTVPPQAAMKIVADLKQSHGKGAALFQKRRARADKYIIDENTVKRSDYQQPSSYIGPTMKPWGQHAPDIWPTEEEPYSGPIFSPIRPNFVPPITPPASEPVFVPQSKPNAPKFGDFNAKPKGFNVRNIENMASKSPRGSIDSRKSFNFNYEPSAHESIPESYKQDLPQPLSSILNPQSILSTNQQQTNDSIKYPSGNILTKWKNQQYSPWNQPRTEDKPQPQIPMTHEGIDQIRHLLAQQNQLSKDQNPTTQNQELENSASQSASISSQGLRQQQQQQHFTDL